MDSTKRLIERNHGDGIVEELANIIKENEAYFTVYQSFLKMSQTYDDGRLNRVIEQALRTDFNAAGNILQDLPAQDLNARLPVIDECMNDPPGGPSVKRRVNTGGVAGIAF